MSQKLELYRITFRANLQQKPGVLFSIAPKLSHMDL